MKKLRYFCTLLLMAVVSVAWAEDELVYTLTPASGSNNAYANNCDIEIAGITWNLTGNSTYQPWRIGGKNLNGVDRTLYSKTAIDDNITKIEVTHGAASSITINSWTLVVASDANFTSVVSTLTPTFTASETTTIIKPDGVDWSNCYYKFIYNVTVSGTSNKFLQFSEAKFYKDATSADAPSISAENVDIAYDATDGGITFLVNNTVEGGSITASCESDWLIVEDEAQYDNEGTFYFTCDANEGAERTATVTLTYSYDNQSVTKNVTVTQAGDPNRPGTENNPYTVAQAIAAIDANTDVTGVYVTGIVSTAGTSLNSGALTYFISDDGTTTTELQAYKGKGLNNANFTSTNDIKVGDNVTIYGNLKKYNSIYEFDAGNYLVAFDRPVSTTPTVTVAQTAVNVVAAGGDGTINVTYENFSQNTDISVQIQDATGAPTTFGWFDADIDNNNNIYYLVDPNTDTAERTAYLRVMVADLDAKEVYYSDVIAITQEAAPSYAALPFSFNSGRSDIDGTDGLSHNGLGTDYSANNAPNTRLKFDTTGDWLLLEFNEEPGILSFDVKGNTFSGGTFKVQTSEDGVTFTDLASYTELGDAATKAYDLDANVRCVKWIYTEKVNGNVGLGNIVLEKSGATVSLTIKQGFTATTFSCDKALDFTGQNIQAYIITDENGTTQAVTTVPANTGLYIEGAAGDYQIPMIASAPAITGNKLVATEQTTGQVLTFTPDASKVYYVFGKQNGKEAFFKVPAAGYTLPDGNKAVLEVDASAGAKEMIVIGGEATGIDSIDNGQLTTDNYYTVDGKLVKGQPTQKGLYIVNGRKVVVK